MTTTMRQAPLCFLVPLIVSTVGTFLLLLVGWNGWPGIVGSSALEYCEALADGMIKQPANTWSNLAFVAAGLGVGWYAGGQLARPDLHLPRNRITTIPLYPMLYATAAALVGPMSMALHASATTWGGKLDVMSMFAWAAFCLMYAIARLRDLSERSFVRGYLALLATLTILFLASPIAGSGSALFGLTIAAFAFVEFAIWWRRPQLRSARSWLVASGAIFAVALFIWWMSHTGHPWCDPQSVVQGHAAWHVLDGIAMVTVYLFFRSESFTGRD